MARRRTVKPTAPPKSPPKARRILATTVREFWDANRIRTRRGHYSIRDGHSCSVDASGRAVLSGTAADPVDREERSARFIPDHTRICREKDGKLSWDGASAYRPMKQKEPA